MWPGRLAAAARTSADAGVEDFLGGEEGDGVEVALDGDAVVEVAPGVGRAGMRQSRPRTSQPVSRMVGSSDAVSTPK